MFLMQLLHDSIQEDLVICLLAVNTANAFQIPSLGHIYAELKPCHSSLELYGPSQLTSMDFEPGHVGVWLSAAVLKG